LSKRRGEAAPILELIELVKATGNLELRSKSLGHQLPYLWEEYMHATHNPQLEVEWGFMYGVSFFVFLELINKSFRV